jgi:hypothetical protein
MGYCDRDYRRPRVSNPATYCSSTPRVQAPAGARWHTRPHGLAIPIHETSGLNEGTGLALMKSAVVDLHPNVAESLRSQMVLYHASGAIFAGLDKQH